MTAIDTEKLPILKLRDDLQFRYQIHGERPSYLIEDALTGHYFHIGLVEYHYIRQLDGNITIPDALKATPELELEQAVHLCHWLLQSQLAYTATSNGQDWVLLSQPIDKTKKFARYLNLLFIKIPLGSPDHFLNQLYPYFKWMLTGWFFLLWLSIILSGIYQLLAHKNQFMGAASQILSIHNALYLLLAWIIIKFIHELFHGLVCKKYGGYVHEIGILLILFTPLGGYVNANASWRFPSKWQKIHVSAAGIFIELLIAGLSVWIWVYTEPGLLHYLAYNLILIAGIGTLFFNANPLMRFDGYYILADLLNIPNLYTLGQRYIHYLIRRYLQGRNESCPLTQNILFIKLYSFATLFWRWFIIITLIFLANYLWEGAGVILAINAVLFLFIIPIGRFIHRLFIEPTGFVIMRRLLLMLSLFTVTIIFLLTQVTWSMRYNAPAVIEYQNAVVIRAESPGFVKEILVKQGDNVEAGQTLLILENKELSEEKTDLALQIQIHELKGQQYFKDNALSAYQTEIEKITELQHKLREKTQQVQDLTIIAPIAGSVVVDYLTDLQDNYLQQGTEILTLAHLQQKEIKLSISQQDIDMFRAQEGQLLTFYRDAMPLTKISILLQKVNPSANQTVIHPALTALAGGAIPVKLKTEKSNEKQELDQYEYLKPRFIGIAHLVDQAIPELQAGETGLVELVSAPETLGNLLYIYFARYFEKLAENRGYNN